MNNPRATAWLWWLALIIATIAGIIIFLIQGEEDYIGGEETISTVIMMAVIGIGLCVISATAHWWIKR